jgi:hypothetical protein
VSYEKKGKDGENQLLFSIFPIKLVLREIFPGEKFAAVLEIGLKLP